MEVERRGAKRARDSNPPKGGFTKKSKSAPRVTDAHIKKVVAKASEMKYYDTTLVATAVTVGTNTLSTPVALLSGIGSPAQGVGVNQRIGNKYLVHTIRIKGRVNTPPGTAFGNGLQAAAIRIAVVRDKEPDNAAAPLLNQIFSSTGVAATQVLALQNPDYMGRFEVFHDEIIVLQDPNTAGTGVHGLYKTFKVEKKYKQPVKVKLTTAGQLVTDNWLLYAWTNSVDLVPSIAFQSRCCFKEE